MYVGNTCPNTAIFWGPTGIYMLIEWIGVTTFALAVM